MRIDSSSIGMESARSYRASKLTYGRFSITDYRGGSLTYNGNALNAAVTDGQTGNGKNVAGNNQGAQTTEDAENKLYTLEDWQNDMSITSGRVKIRNISPRFKNPFEDLRQATMRYIFDLLFTGRRERTPSNYQQTTQSSSQQTTQSGYQQTVQSNSQQTLQLSTFNVRMVTFEQGAFQFEQEDTAFSTVGTVRTSDGREINFNVDIAMSREFRETFGEELSMPSAKMCDPLVINLDTDVAQLSDQKFYFDIDADGVLDEISQLDVKSGYLALDKNGDGVINDGSELFGTSSGDGFSDLAQYDEDGNGWIDENDAIWSKLKIWCKDENGNDVLYRLADKGVGAICLQNASTDFTLKGAGGSTNGAIRRTGVFLYENGNVGTVQHVDVAKYEQGA